MPGFTKLFSTIVDSTIWREDLHVKVVWVTMLAKADKNGMVAMSLPGLADASRVTLAQCKDALCRFLGPDEYSRTKDFDGRRIMEADGGWILLNYLKYRKAQDEDETRIATAERVRRFRERHSVTQPVTNVTHVTPSNAIAEAEAEKKEVAIATSKKKPKKEPPAFPDEVKEAARGIAKASPETDPQGRAIKINPAILLERLSTCFKENDWLTPDLAIGAWTEYLRTSPEWVKASHYFFGREQDQKGGAHWYAYAHALWNRQARAKQQQPILLEA